ncbi:hypothetical protein ACIOWF_05155 [Cellulosimicrobium cellulans]|uniref:hypothetical protein n=1 Tax=Cellulosimicrobium cellulans TaxID=1710 RepID=UPI00380ACA92
MTDDTMTPAEEVDEIGLTARERRALGLRPARKIERDPDGEPTAAELARRLWERR